MLIYYNDDKICYCDNILLSVFSYLPNKLEKIVTSTALNSLLNKIVLIIVVLQ